MLLTVGGNFRYHATGTDFTLDASDPAEQQAAIVHDCPATPNPARIDNTVGYDIGSIYFTDDTEAGGGNPYDTLPTHLATLATDIDNVNQYFCWTGTELVLCPGVNVE